MNTLLFTEMRYKLLLLLIIAAIPRLTKAQQQFNSESFTHADTLRGALSPLRSCYDINYYHLDVKLNIDQRFISGNNLFVFTAIQDFTVLQFDLFANMKVDSVVYKKKNLPYTRDANAVFVTFPKIITKGSKDEFLVYYSGGTSLPRKNGFGGWVFAKDSLNKPWISVNCQGNGASMWWPNKDHLSDEVDSMMISVSVPRGLKDISNGRLRKITHLKNGYTRFDWFVSNPINNYNVTVNVGDYVHFSDSYMGEKGKLSIDYWVLPASLEKAKKHFGANVKPTLKAFEYWFGPYPFYKDGYKLIESAYPGMEHQSAISYGNNFKYGELGEDVSHTGWGLKWDYIITHESAHEWFGNSISMKDLADMWIHESFACYAESLFTESSDGKKAGQEYNKGQYYMILNEMPIVGPYHVNKNGAKGDMYTKGAAFLGMIRVIINDDEKWRNILRGLGRTFYHQTVTYEQVVNYISTQSGKDLLPVFDQYLHYKNVPILEFTVKNGKLSSRWIADVKNFSMPVQVRVKGGAYKFITPTTALSTVEIDGATNDNIEVNTSDYYIGTRKV